MKYSGGKDGLSKKDIWNALKGQRVLMDPVGAFGAMFECQCRLLSSPSRVNTRLTSSTTGFSVYLLLWPEDGIIKKEDVRRIYDGSIFFHIASQRKKED